jgi:hypothetical protein
MKKLSKLRQVMAFGFAILIFAACSSQKNATVANKVSKGAVSGTWTVSDVRLEGFPSGYQVNNAFDLAPYQDFVGSTWTLYGGYGGSISLTNGTTQEIYWSLINNGVNPTFQFKKINAGEKAREVREGYQLEVAEATKTSLILRSPFPLTNGGTGYIVYSFVNAK